MSMFWSGYSGTGLVVVDPDDIKYLMEHVKHIDNNEYEDYEIEEILIEEYGAMRLDDNNMEGCYFRNGGRGEYLDEYFPVYFFFSQKQPTLHELLSSGFYKSKEEIINEFQEKLGGLLPSDFDWDNAIGDIQYACYA